MNGDKEKPAGLKIERHRATGKEQGAWALGSQSGVNGAARWTAGGTRGGVWAISRAVRLRTRVCGVGKGTFPGAGK